MNPTSADRQAVVCHGPRDERLEPVAKPAAGPNERDDVVAIAGAGPVAACGIGPHDSSLGGWETAFVPANALDSIKVRLEP
jgi:hypothetical protein